MEDGMEGWVKVLIVQNGNDPHSLAVMVDAANFSTRQGNNDWDTVFLCDLVEFIELWLNSGVQIVGNNN